MRRLVLSVALAVAASASAQVRAQVTSGGSGGGGLTSPVSADPLSFTGAVTFNNAANTPLVCSDGLQDSTLTAGRVTFAGASGRLSDDADLTFATDTLSATKLTVATTLTSPNLVSAAGAAQAISSTAPVQGASSQAGAAVTITASNAVAGSSNAGAAAGGSVTITAGNAARLTSGNANGGDIILSAGAGIGTGTAGAVVIGQGSAAKPALVFSLGLTTGLYLPASDRMSIAVAGSEWLRFDQGTANFGARPIGFSSTFGTADAGLIRDAAGVVRVTAGASGAGALLHLLGVETVATTKAPAVTESAELYTNGADVDGQAITLTNDPTVGTCFEFALTSTDTSNSFAIAPSAGETLMDAATTCSTSFSATAKGATARICAVSGGSGALWLVMSKNGTWTCS